MLRSMEQRDLFFGDDLPEGILTDSHIHVPGLDPMPLDHVAWQEWARNQLAHRERVARDCNLHPAHRAMYKALCAQPYGLGQIYFAVTFAWIYEPREDDDLAMVPMILYPAQAKLLMAIDAAMRRPKGQYASIAVPKSRGVGATWMGALDDTWRWAFKKTYQGRFVSRNEDLVDQTGNSDSYFWKLDYIVKFCPAWLMPQGYSVERGVWRTHMKMVNPVTGSAIIGEATTSGIGVGGRATKYTGDEAARLRNLRGIHGQLGETTNHRVYFSTHNLDVSTDFWDMCAGENGWQGLQPVIFPMPWDSVPGRDEAWLAETRKTMTDEMFQREVMMNPHAGISTWGYPEAKQIRPKPDCLWIPSAGLGITSMDDGYDDDFAVIFSQWDRTTRRLKILDGYQNSHKPIAFYGCLLRGMADNRWPWDYEALRLMPWIRQYQLWQNIHLGDRHGDNTDLTSGISAWQKLHNEFGIVVTPSSHVNNDDKSRRDAASELLAITDFAATPGAWAVLEAMQKARFPEPKEGQNLVFEQKKMIHDQTSHFRTAFEYLAVYVMETFVGRTYGIAAEQQAESSRNGWLHRSTSSHLGREPYRRRKDDQGVRNTWIR